MHFSISFQKRVFITFFMFSFLLLLLTLNKRNSFINIYSKAHTYTLTLITQLAKRVSLTHDPYCVIDTPHKQEQTTMQIMLSKLNNYAIYKIDVIVRDDPNWHLLYVGVAKLRDVLKLSEARRVPYANRIINNAVEVCLTIMEQFSDEASAMIARDGYIKDWNPPGNNPENHMRDRKGANTPVVRSDGMEYASITEAARAIGSAPQSISHHLAGRYGYETVKSYTFRRFE